MSQKLKKGLGLIDVFCIASGAMISSGLFILPGIAFAKAGPSVIFSYLIAGLLCLPTLFSMAELTTAMPRAGGDYFYITRGFGPLLGTVAGFSTWFSLSLKGAFALIGIAAYVSAYSTIPMPITATVCCACFMLLNILGAKEAGKFQVLLVCALFIILLSYVGINISAINLSSFTPIAPHGIGATLSTASFVFVSYGGLTAIAALAEETKNPGKTIPLGIILALILTTALYVLVVFVTIGIMPPDLLQTSLTPISDAAHHTGHRILEIAISIGGILAFITTANSGILSASRYPLGMSRDRLLPPLFQKTSSRFQTPYISVLFTGIFMILAIVTLDIDLLVKIASSILILLYFFSNMTLILFRESNILSYRPKFIAPFYPYLQIAGMLGSIFLLIEMGSAIAFFTMLFLALGIWWYSIYGRKHGKKGSALFYTLEHLVSSCQELSSDALLDELKEIVIERDALVKDTFHLLIEDSHITDIDHALTAEEFFYHVAKEKASLSSLSLEDMINQFLSREQSVSTIIKDGIAVPHIIVPDLDRIHITIARCKDGIAFPHNKQVHLAFVLFGCSNKRQEHLETLAGIAEIAQQDSFCQAILNANTEHDMKHCILLAERTREESA